MKTLLLIDDVRGFGQRFEIIEVNEAVASELLARRVALVALPAVRRRFGDAIKKAAGQKYPPIIEWKRNDGSFTAKV